MRLIAYNSIVKGGMYMVKIQRIWTKDGTRFTLRRLDRTAVCCKYFRAIGQARKFAEELGLTVIN